MGDAETGDAETGDAETGDAETRDAETGDAEETRDAETVGMFGEKFTRIALAWPPSPLIFPVGLCSILVTRLVRLSDVFVLLQSLFFVRCKIHMPQTA